MHLNLTRHPVNASVTVRQLAGRLTDLGWHPGSQAALERD